MGRREISDEHYHLDLWLDQGINLERRIIMLDEDVADMSISLIIRGLYKMSEGESSEPIHVIINSYGGDCYAAISLYDTLRHLSCPIYTYIIGKAMSAGTFIFMAGDQRYAYPNSTFMVHSVSSWCSGKVGDLEVDTEEAKRLWKLYSEVYAERTGHRTQKWWHDWAKHQDRYFTYDRAVELNFITHELGEGDLIGS